MLKMLPSVQTAASTILPYDKATTDLFPTAVNTPNTSALPKLPKWMHYDPFLWVIVATFIVYEIVAHFEFHNEAGMQTLSNRIVFLIKEWGWPARVLIAICCVALSVHLQGIF